MKPGTKPKPTHLKLVTGNPGKRTLNPKEAKAKASIPVAPHHLTADAPASLILDQVSGGLAVRMAVLYHLLAGEGSAA